MRSFKTLIGLIAGIALLSTSSLAQAQALSLRTEVGVAVPITAPQSNRFNVGGSIDIKPELGLGHYFSLGPSFSFLALPSTISGIDAGTVFGAGGFLRLKRPHDAVNTGTGLSAVSPWIDADASYVRTGPLDRFGYAVSIGASWPTSDARNLWLGPFVRYQDVYQETTPHFDSRDAKIMIFGLSMEMGGKTVKKEVPPVPPIVIVVKENPPPTVEVPVVVVSQEVVVEYKEVIQFAWDSPVLDSTAAAHLEEVLKKLVASKSYSSIKVEGYASSEGQLEHNKTLSQHRADAVVAFLIARGIPQDKLSAVGLGITNPVATNTTQAGRILNRRDEFVVKFVVVKEGASK